MNTHVQRLLARTPMVLGTRRSTRSTRSSHRLLSHHRQLPRLSRNQRTTNRILHTLNGTSDTQLPLTLNRRLTFARHLHPTHRNHRRTRLLRGLRRTHHARIRRIHHLTLHHAQSQRQTNRRTTLLHPHSKPALVRKLLPQLLHAVLHLPRIHRSRVLQKLAPSQKQKLSTSHGKLPPTHRSTSTIPHPRIQLLARRPLEHPLRHRTRDASTRLPLLTLCTYQNHDGLTK